MKEISRRSNLRLTEIKNFFLVRFYLFSYILQLVFICFPILFPRSVMIIENNENNPRITPLKSTLRGKSEVLYH